MVPSELLTGIDQLKLIRNELATWLVNHEYTNIKQLAVRDSSVGVRAHTLCARRLERRTSPPPLKTTPLGSPKTHTRRCVAAERDSQHCW
jgi:hypothetical protein